MNWSKEYVQARVVRNTQAFESFIGQLRHAANSSHSSSHS